VHELATTLLDLIGLLTVAAGVVLGLLPLVGGVALVPGGLVVLAGSWWAARPPKRADV